MSSVKDTDYLSVSARVRYLETKRLSQDVLDKLVASKTVAEALDVLCAAGFGERDESFADAERFVEMARERLCRFVSDNVPSQTLCDVVRLPYDYACLKAALKAEQMGVSPASMLVSGGTLDPGALCAAVTARDKNVLSARMLKALEESLDAVAKTNDRQQIDLICDRACYEDIDARAREAGMPFLAEFFAARADAANLLMFLRLRRVGKDVRFFTSAALPQSARLPLERLVHLYAEPDTAVAEALRSTPYAAVADAVTPKGQFDLPAVARLLKEAEKERVEQLLRVPFGPQVPFAYLLIKLDELDTLRVLLARKAQEEAV